MVSLSVLYCFVVLCCVVLCSSLLFPSALLSCALFLLCASLVWRSGASGGAHVSPEAGPTNCTTEVTFCTTATVPWRRLPALFGSATMSSRQSVGTSTAIVCWLFRTLLWLSVDTSCGQERIGRQAQEGGNIRRHRLLDYTRQKKVPVLKNTT